MIKGDSGIEDIYRWGPASGAEHWGTAWDLVPTSAHISHQGATNFSLSPCPPVLQAA